MRHGAGRRLLPVLAAMTALSIVSCGLEDASEPGTTVPGVQLPASHDLLVVGDWGSGTASQERVAEAMADHASDRDVAAIVTTGDNLYSDDVDSLMEPFAWTSGRDIPLLVSWGNHDLDTTRRIELVEETFGGAPRWVVHEWGEVDIVILDSTQVESRAQVGFLVQALEESEDPTIVVFHHPPYSCGSHGGSEEVLDQWISRFDDDVFLVLNGHEHNYQRFDSDGVAYVVTGGGGRSLTELADCSSDHPERIAGAETHHFVSMRMSDGLDVTVIDSGGAVIDEFSLVLPSRR